MYFKIMDYVEYIPRAQDIGWRVVQFYTWLTMMWSRYVTPNLVNTSGEYYPFAIVEKDGLRQLVYYSDIEATEFTFISAIVRVNDKDEYDLNLRPFFVVENRILNRDFIKWYLKVNYNKNLEDTDNYVVHIIDNNVNQISIESDEYIKLNKDNYLKIKSDE